MKSYYLCIETDEYFFVNQFNLFSGYQRIKYLLNSTNSRFHLLFETVHV